MTDELPCLNGTFKVVDLGNGIVEISLPDVPSHSGQCGTEDFPFESAPAATWYFREHARLGRERIDSPLVAVNGRIWRNAFVAPTPVATPEGRRWIGPEEARYARELWAQFYSTNYANGEEGQAQVNVVELYPTLEEVLESEKVAAAALASWKAQEGTL